MGLFSRKTQPEPIRDLEDRMRRLERLVEEQRLDWDLTYEKFQRLSARLAKRARDAEEAPTSPQEPGNGGKPTITNPLALELLRGRS